MKADWIYFPIARRFRVVSEPLIIHLAQSLLPMKNPCGHPTVNLTPGRRKSSTATTKEIQARLMASGRSCIFIRLSPNLSPESAAARTSLSVSFQGGSHIAGLKFGGPPAPTKLAVTHIRRRESKFLSHFPQAHSCPLASLPHGLPDLSRVLHLANSTTLRTFHAAPHFCPSLRSRQ